MSRATPLHHFSLIQSLQLRAAISAFSLIFLLTGCSDNNTQPAAEAPRLVRTATATPGVTSDWMEYPGLVEAAQTANLGFRVPGKLATMKVKEGDLVNKNQILATLDDTDYQIKLTSSQAEFNQAKADFERGQSLLKQNLIAKSDYDKLDAQYSAASASLKAAKQNVQYTTLRAPFSGVIAIRHVDNFEDVSTMQPIFTIQDLSSLHIRVAIPEKVMIKLKKQSDMSVSAVFEGVDHAPVPLALQAVETQADTSSQTFDVTFNMPRVDNLNVLPGMSVTVRGTKDLSATNSAILVPAQSVIENNLGRFVYVVTDIHNGLGTIDARPVETGKVTERGIVILDGIDVGERVVSAGMSKMTDGLVVRVSEEWNQ